MTSSLPHPKSPFLKDAIERGFFHQCTDLEALDQLCLKENLTFYIGFDATAKSLHVGNLTQIMIARLAQKHGLKPLILMGGGTTKIGDPSGKSELRQILSDDEISQNIQSIKEIFSLFLTFGEEKNDAQMLNNDQWLSGLNYISFLRDYGKYFSINRMLTFDSIKLRLEREQPLSFIEFNYMVFQSYDFLELFRKNNCRLQIGGSDQWGNIVSGVDLVRRALNIPVFGLTTPLITTASGTKMGKTAQGAIWLREDLLSPYDYWQFWRNTDDQDVQRFLKFFTNISIEEIERICAPSANLNDAKKILADAATTLVHGRDKTQQAHTTAASLFEHDQDISDIQILGRNPNTRDIQVASTLPIIELDGAELLQGKPILDLFVMLDLCKSKGEARRLIDGKGARMNDGIILDPSYLVTSKDIASNGLLKLSVGKKRHALIYVETLK